MVFWFFLVFLVAHEVEDAHEFVINHVQEHTMNPHLLLSASFDFPCETVGHQTCSWTSSHFHILPQTPGRCSIIHKSMLWFWRSTSSCICCAVFNSFLSWYSHQSLEIIFCFVLRGHICQLVLVYLTLKTGAQLWVSLLVIKSSPTNLVCSTTEMQIAITICVTIGLFGLEEKDGVLSVCFFLLCETTNKQQKAHPFSLLLPPMAELKPCYPQQYLPTHLTQFEWLVIGSASVNGLVLSLPFFVSTTSHFSAKGATVGTQKVSWDNFLSECHVCEGWWMQSTSWGDIFVIGILQHKRQFSFEFILVQMCTVMNSSARNQTTRNNTNVQSTNKTSPTEKSSSKQVTKRTPTSSFQQNENEKCLL